MIIRTEVESTHRESRLNPAQTGCTEPLCNDRGFLIALDALFLSHKDP